MQLARVTSHAKFLLELVREPMVIILKPVLNMYGTSGTWQHQMIPQHPNLCIFITEAIFKTRGLYGTIHAKAEMDPKITGQKKKLTKEDTLFTAQILWVDAPTATV